jgi:hypothetical protein
MSFDLRAEGYRQPRAIAFHHKVDALLKTIPGVIASVQAAGAPLGGRHYFSSFSRPGETRARQMEYNVVSPGFFATVGIPIVRGRDFATSEESGEYAIVSEAAASAFWPGEDPLGKKIHAEHTYTIIGVARDAQVSELGVAHAPFIYLSRSNADALEMGTVVVRSSAPLTTVGAALRAGVLAEDRDLHLRIAPLRDNMRGYIDASRMLAGLSGTLAALALALASIGIYGTVAFTVARRTREIGIRIALGAAGHHVIAEVTRHAIRTVAVGSGVGLLICLLVTRVLERVLFGVSALDAAAFLGVQVVLFTVALVATVIPARRAVGVDPMVALRAE